MSSIKQYNDNADKYVSAYESISFEDVHKAILDLLPEADSSVLDIGAGSGRDSAWFASKGYQVIAVEPAEAMLQKGKLLHPDPRIRWLQDSLPSLVKTITSGHSFDLIWLSAVWMHILPSDRERAFRKMLSVLRAGGMIMISLRHGTFYDGRETYPVSVDEIEKLSRRYGLSVRNVFQSEDELGRTGVKWETVCLKLPDDGTEALPLLRHIILNDSKSSTYKLALLRILVRIADSATGMARPADDNHIAIPLGLVALYWLRTYKILVELDIPQMPPTSAQTKLSFVGEAFQHLKLLSTYDLRVGATFTGTDAAWLREALIDAKNTIHKMPAYYIKYPNSAAQIFVSKPLGRVPKLTTYTLDDQFLSSFGELHIPQDIWHAMSRFASWIEPSLLSEWVRLMQTYLEAQDRKESYDRLMQALAWLDPERDTMLVRSITQKLFVTERPLYCVWSGKRLHMDSCDIDHCFPFSAWPCNDLWNLMPANRAINQRQKGNKLVTANMLERARERMTEWWQLAYVENDDFALGERFISEASAALAVVGMDPGAGATPIIFEGVALKRAALKQNLQLPDWEL